ncbi:hypothetical protein K3G63_06025 [Hymenobacter sp. HSC-4F20]|uniref:hypothetical protein n=1 Tax=Hymenobacter sp. HSC-4F20 TaxID=2864135 RepID=UPI001C73A01B|nr:hypothetical protein [Hymenobacter sp. HSC-4F20]MBX0289988.1 hypothetical protein [Hymenobacter sp. HSC-4F20]
MLLCAGCGEQGCNLPEPAALQYAVRLVEDRTGQDLFAPGTGFLADSVRFYEVLPGGSLALKAVAAQRTGRQTQFGPIRHQPGTGSSRVPGSSGLGLTYTDVLVRLNRQDTDTLTLVVQSTFRGGDECGQVLPARLQFYYNGRLNATYSVATPDSLRAFTAPAVPVVELRK